MTKDETAISRCPFCGQEMRPTDYIAKLRDRALPAREGVVVPEGYTPVRTAILEWLDGAAPHPDTGQWFERPENERGAFWWRKHLTKAMLAAAKEKPDGE